MQGEKCSSWIHAYEKIKLTDSIELSVFNFCYNKLMENSIKKGLSFGLASGVITTLGLMVGMYSGTRSQSVIIGSILTIAIADSLSDGLGMHLSEESQSSSTSKSIWQATFSAIVTKFLIALTFIIPIVALNLNTAIVISVIWGILLIILFSYYLAISKKERPINVILEHIGITILVIVLTYLVGNWISTLY